MNWQQLDEYILYKSTLSKIIKVSDVNIEGIDLDNTINSLEKKGLIYILDNILYNPNNCILDGIKIIINC